MSSSEIVKDDDPVTITRGQLGGMCDVTNPTAFGDNASAVLATGATRG